jgi:hypothetical protein
MLGTIAKLRECVVSVIVEYNSSSNNVDKYNVYSYYK